MLVPFATTPVAPSPGVYPECDTTIGIEIETGANRTLSDGRIVPINVWDELGFTAEKDTIPVKDAGSLTTEAGPFNLELITNPCYTLELLLSHYDLLVADLQKRLGAFAFDLGEWDDRVPVPCSLEEWVPKQRYAAMLEAYKLLSKQKHTKANPAGFLAMACWRSTHVSFGAQGEHKIRLADVLTHLAPFIYRRVQKRFALESVGRVQKAYDWWEPVGYGPGRILHYDQAGYDRYITQFRRLIRWNKSLGLFEPDLETFYGPGEDVSEMHPWSRVRNNRVEFRILPPMHRAQLEIVLGELIQIVNILLDSLWGTLNQMPEEAWAKALHDLQVLGFDLPHRVPTEDEWYAEIARC